MKTPPNQSRAKLLPLLTLPSIASICLLVAISVAHAVAQTPAQAPTPAQTQEKSPGNSPAPAQPPAAAKATQNPGDPAQASSAEVRPVEARKDQIAADSAKLFQLANELKAEMDKSTKDTLSLSVMKKAEEVEKLARKVRDEMRASLAN